MAVFIDLWPCLFTTKLSYAQLFKWDTLKKYDDIVLVFYNVQIFKRTFLRDEPNHNIRHFRPFFCSGGSRAAKMASSKTFFRPFCVRAEHSTYLTARNSFASFSPASKLRGFCLFFASLSIVAASSLKSICVPTWKRENHTIYTNFEGWSRQVFWIYI